MLSLRYAIRQVGIELVSSMQALQLVVDNEGISRLKVRFSENDVPAIPIIVKRNTLLFQVLENIYAEGIDGSVRPRSKPTDEVITEFRNDLAVVIWPPRVDKMVFMDNGNAFSLSGEKLRRKMFEEGFDIGETHMVPLLAGAGMSRSGKYLFIREKLRKDVLSRITLGLVDADREAKTCPDQRMTQADKGGKVKKETVLNLHETQADTDGKEKVTVNPAKLLAYIGLADTDGVSLAELGEIWQMSKAARQADQGMPQQIHTNSPQTSPADHIKIDSNSVVVVKDVYRPLGIKAIGEYVIRNSNEDGGEVSLRKLSSEDRACLTDGYGFICPEWSLEINRLRYCRSTGECNEGEFGGFRSRAFIIRLPFVKGAVIECDYIRYLRELGVQEITDMWGCAHSLNDVKMILTESMFKGSKLFPHATGRAKEQSVWEFYCQELEKSGLSMILAGNDSAPTERTSLNYQFLSSMQPDDAYLDTLISWELARQDERLKLLEGPAADENGECSADEIQEFADSVIRHLEESVRVEAEQQTEQAQKDAIADATDVDGAPDLPPQIDIASEMDAPVAEEATGAVAAKCRGNASYAELLVQLLRKYPRAAFTRTVMEEFASVTVKVASDASQGRIRVAGDVRILCGDPFVLLNSIAKRSGARISHLKLALLQSSGLVYAPGLKNSELLLLRNPHVSAFEAIVAKNLDTERTSGGIANARDKYRAYFGAHRGVIFINSAVASTLGGADFDGDRAKVIFEPSAIELVKSNTEKINALLKLSQDAGFMLDMNASVKGKALPIVSIQGFPAKNLTVKEMNASFWDHVYDTYMESIDSKVGKYSVRGATLAFNHGMVTAVQPENPDQVAQAVAFLKMMARLTTVIGLDIDAAKSGTAPKEPQIGKMGGMPPILCFSRNYKKNASPDEPVLQRYQNAYEDAKRTSAGNKTPRKPEKESEEEDSATVKDVNERIQNYDRLGGTSAASKLVDSFSLARHYNDLQRWLPTAGGRKYGKDEKNEKEEIRFTDVLCEGLDGTPDAAMSAALNELRVSTEFAGAARSAAGKMTRITDWILQRRVDILQHLMRYYPLSMALDLDKRIVKGAEDAAEEIKLDNDSAMIELAFCDNERRKEMLRETIFGAQKDEDFIYDVTALQLAKHVQRLRNALASKKELLRTIEAGSDTSVFVSISYVRQRAVIRSTAAKYHVDCWELGLWMMKRGIIREKDFVLLFVADMKDSAGEEVETHDQPQSGSK